MSDKPNEAAVLDMHARRNLGNSIRALRWGLEHKGEIIAAFRWQAMAERIAEEVGLCDSKGAIRLIRLSDGACVLDLPADSPSAADAEHEPDRWDGMS